MLYRPFENKLNFHLAEHQLHRAQWSIFHYLSNNGSATLVELSHYLYVEKPTVTRTINRLEELGYVEQVPTNDKREKRTQLTELGRKIYTQVRVTIDQFENDILKGISEHEQLEAIRIMSLIRDNIIK
ncbi:MarR family transcriptional regulator [Bacillus sp. sid0103]|uniref:MarR family winged helix-turn-helix transcriptional regulator n=1 Tax=Bacillus sp. sid0103 TaxID=2856337 RepID=UPI001C491299|nr:MarR family transcriptional regulator [Bacillus sp. sid0103]MBV7507865.1 MarR family transcriptional regulator [Bacillus sp. sid0103]